MGLNDNVLFVRAYEDFVTNLHPDIARIILSYIDVCYNESMNELGHGEEADRLRHIAVRFEQRLARQFGHETRWVKKE